MKKFLFISLLLLLLTSCSKTFKVVESKENVDDVDRFERLNKTKPFFDFDHVAYYHNGITEMEFTDITLKEGSLTRKEKNLINAMILDIPKTLNDTLMNSINENYPIKIELSKDEITIVRDIFQEKYKDRDWHSGCIPIYRDVLVFRKEDKITGIAKICFSCWEFSFSGTKVNTKGFGLNGELDKLQSLLSSELPEGSTIKQQ